MPSLNPLAPVLLPRPLGLTPRSYSVSSGRAQSFSVSKLNYRKDIDKAKVSVSQLARNKQSAVISVGHLNDQLKPEGVYEAETDERRYDYVRGLAMANRQKKLKKEQK